MLKLTLRKYDAPSYRVASLELPEREDILAKKLEEIGVGITLEKNCLVEKLEGDGGALQVLVGRKVNADEMQYLTKRMESFDANELLKFRAAVTVEKLIEIKDLINLTFNLRCYTAITDFSDVARIGRDHLLSKLMAVSCDKLATTDCEAIGRELIADGGGIVTPYGVLYRNGNQPEQIYNGRQFPLYDFRNHEAMLTLSMDEDYKVSETLYLPCFEVEMQKALIRLGANAPECLATLDFPRLYPSLLKLFDRLGPEQYLEELNELARCYQCFEEEEEEKFQAIVECAAPADPMEALLLAKNFWEFTVAPGVQTPEEYGRYVTMKSGPFDFDPHLADYIDFKGYGLRRIQEENGVFTDYGYIAYCGKTALVEEIMERRGTQGQQMGGMI